MAQFARALRAKAEVAVGSIFCRSMTISSDIIPKFDCPNAMNIIVALILAFKPSIEVSCSMLLV